MATYTIKQRRILSTPAEFDDRRFLVRSTNLVVDLLAAVVLTAGAVGILYLLGTYLGISYPNSGTHDLAGFRQTSGVSTTGSSAEFGPVLK